MTRVLICFHVKTKWSARKCLWMASKTQKSQMFSFVQISCYMVFHEVVIKRIFIISFSWIWPLEAQLMGENIYFIVSKIFVKIVKNCHVNKRTDRNAQPCSKMYVHMVTYIITLHHHILQHHIFFSFFFFYTHITSSHITSSRRHNTATFSFHLLLQWEPGQALVE